MIALTPAVRYLIVAAVLAAAVTVRYLIWRHTAEGSAVTTVLSELEMGDYIEGEVRP